MKKTTRVLALLMASVLLMVACNGSVTSSKVSVDYSNVGLPKLLQITSPNFFDEGERDTYDVRMEWLDTLSARYGVGINVLNPSIEYYSDTISQAIAGTTNGVMDAILNDTVLYLKNKGIILPLDEYLANNKTWNSLPAEMRKMYEYDGHIWAVPSAYEITQTVRAIRQDWLDKLGLKAPKTIDDLYNILIAFRDRDPDGDGDVTNTIPLSGEQGLGWARDIMAAFGASISEGGLLPYSYNPESGAFEDAFLKPEAKLALEFLRKMYQEGLIDKEIFSTETNNFSYNVSKGYVGTYMTNAGNASYYLSMDLKETMNPDTFYDPNDPEDWKALTGLYTEIAALTGNKTENLSPVTYFGSPYVLLANTDEPAETINFFVDMLYSSQTNYLESLVGLDTHYTMTSDNVIKMNYSDEANNEYYPLASLVGYIEGVHPRTEFTIVKSQSPQAILNKREINQYLSNFTKSSLEQKLAYVQDNKYAYPQSAHLTDFLNDVMIEFKNCFTDAITDPNSTVDQALQAYRKNMQDYNAQTILNEANSAIGKKSTQKY